jgi:hypothetical protein
VASGSASSGEPLVAVGDAPLAVLVRHAHLHDVAVAVHVVGLEARLLFRLGPGPRGGPQGMGGGEVAFGAIGREAGEDVEGLFVEETGGEVIRAVVLEEVFDQVERGHRAGDLAGVGVAVHPEGRFRARRSRRRVGELREPDVASPVALAYGPYLTEVGVLFRERAQGPRELLVAQVGVELGLHGLLSAGPGVDYGPLWRARATRCGPRD